MERIKHLLDSATPLDVIDTGVAPRYKKDRQIKAIIFDIYGTLLISASGDVEQSEICSENLNNSLLENGYRFSENGTTQEKRTDKILQFFLSAIKSHHAKEQKNNNPFPEIDILKVWEETIQYASNEKWIENTGHLKKMTFEFELLSNKVYPMPYMQSTLEHIKNAGYPMGIISNAQFYTPVILNYFLHRVFEEKETLEYFDPGLTIFSYKELKAKPNQALFNKTVSALHAKYGLKPEQVVFVGNDMYKDIYPAKKAGMKTILFAGDKRSLRLRDNKKEVKNIQPDHIITDLSQIQEIVL
jgi:putative hydrolase of the HAD superfamily